MNEKYLTFEQNLCAARVFLNTFGFILEDCKNITKSLKIFNKNMDEVGNLRFDNNETVIIAKYNNATLRANYETPKVFSFIDVETKNIPFALYGEWQNKIKFEINHNPKIAGEFLITCSIDTEFGIKCKCHPLINCDVFNNDKLILEILRNGLIFGLEIKNNNSHEIINISPWDNLNGYIKHVISSGKYDASKYQHEYKKYAGVFAAGIGDEDKLHVFLSETEWDKQITFKNLFPLKLGTNNSEDLIIQKGKLMKDLDPDMFKKIQELKETLKIDNVSLLDNLISVCYDNYTDKELYALLGIIRKKMEYQNKATCLIDSYYGINNEHNILQLKL